MGILKILITMAIALFTIIVVLGVLIFVYQVKAIKRLKQQVKIMATQVDEMADENAIEVIRGEEN